VVEATLFSPTIVNLAYSTYLCYNNMTFGFKNKTSVWQSNLKINRHEYQPLPTGKQLQSKLKTPYYWITMKLVLFCNCNIKPHLLALSFLV